MALAASRRPAFPFRPYATLLTGVALLLGGCASFPPVPAPVATVEAPHLSAGDSWVYEQTNPYNRSRVRTLTETLEPAPNGYRIVKRSDRERDPVETDSYGAPWLVASESGGPEPRDFSPPLRLIPFPLQSGSTWRQAIKVGGPGRTYTWFVDGSALGWERVPTPAGSFSALKVVLLMNLGDGDWMWGDRQVTETLWYAPEVKRWVRREYRSKRSDHSCVPRVEVDWKLWELRSYRLGS